MNTRTKALLAGAAITARVLIKPENLLPEFDYEAGEQ